MEKKKAQTSDTKVHRRKQSKGKTAINNGGEAITTRNSVKEKSTSSNEQEEDAPKKRNFGVEEDMGIHIAQDSLISNSSGFQNYRGFLNLCIVLLAMSSGRLVLENLMKYGILIDPISWASVFWKDPYSWPNITLAICINYFILFALGIEKLTIKTYLHENLIDVLSIGNILTLIIFPVVVVTVVEPNPVGAAIVLSMYAISAMKLYSYYIVNGWCRGVIRKRPKQNTNKSSIKRKKKTSPEKDPKEQEDKERTLEGPEENGINTSEAQILEQEYPENVNLKDMYYFIVAPTLCYDLNFPRTKRIRKRFLIRRIVELIFLLHLTLCLIQQWIVPLVVNAMKPFSEMDVTRMVERILKLAVPNHFIWLCFFYFYFHSFLNILGEVLMFADREFYRDWWNSETVGYFWRNWNIPVHRWARRHVYKPLRRRGYNAYSGQVMVFIMSAIFHEYLLSVPLHMFKLWAFTGMMLQIPLAYVVSTFFKRHYGNMAVWVSVIIGQPVAVLMYVHDYYVINYMNTNGTIPVLSLK